MEQLKKDLAEGIIFPLYLVTGPEAYLRRECKNALRRTLLGDDEINFTYREGKNVDLEELSEIAQTVPFLAPRRMILLENSGLAKKGGDALEELLPQIPPECVLVLVEEESDKRTRLYKTIQRTGRVVDCNYLSEGDLKKSAKALLKQAGCSIDAEALDLLMDRCGGELSTLAGETDKLAAYCMERGKVSLADVEAVTSVTLQSRIFSMIDAMALGRPREAYLMYEELRALRESPMRILYLITQHVSRLLAVKELDGRGLSSQSIGESLGLKPFLVGKYAHQARALTGDVWQKRLAHLVEYDHNVKQGKLSDTLAVELALVEMSMR